MTRRMLRPGLALLFGTELVLGLWTVILPRTFFDIPWVAMLPPYNEHLMRDYGAMNLGMSVLLGVAVVTMERRSVLTALTAYLVFSVIHFTFHATHLEHYGVLAAVGQTTALALTVVLPVAFLVMARRTLN